MDEVYISIEEFRSIWGTNNYEVSMSGKVRNITTGHILKHYTSKKGKRCVTISDSDYKCREVRRIVQDAWK